jgi:hypothetical protein
MCGSQNWSIPHTPEKGMGENKEIEKEKKG